MTKQEILNTYSHTECFHFTPGQVLLIMQQYADQEIAKACFEQGKRTGGLIKDLQSCLQKFYDLYYHEAADWDDEWIVLFEEANDILTGTKIDPDESSTQPAYKGLLAEKENSIKLLADMIIEILADIRRKPNDTRYATVVKKATELLFKLKCGLDPVPKS